MFTIIQNWRQREPVPANLRSTFFHLYGDIGWYGIFAGSTIAFASVYVARLGATGLQIGLLNAGPAIINLAFTLPAGGWLHRHPIGPAVFWTALLSRLAYLPWIFIPLLPWAQAQVWSLILLILLASIPGTMLAIGFNSLYASTVPPLWRGQVMAVRNGMLSVVYVATSILCGVILNRFPLTIGYQIVFGLGFLGAAMSTVHLWFLRKQGLPMTNGAQPAAAPTTMRSTLGDYAYPGTARFLGLTLRSSIGLRIFARSSRLLRPDLLRGTFLRLLAALFFFHFGQFFAIPLFPLRWVDQLHFNDGQISLGTAVFYAAVLFGSVPFGWMTNHWGNRRLTASGAILLSSYPLLSAFMTGLPVYLIASVLGGLAWAFVGGALANYLLEKIPDDDRPAHLAWYNLSLNGAILLGSISGPLLATRIGVVNALLCAFLLRLFAGVSLWFVDRTKRVISGTDEDDGIQQAE